MAWFHKTLVDMQRLAEEQLKKPAEQQEWGGVLEILKQHNFVEKQTEKDLADAAFYIKQYEEDLRQIAGFLSETRRRKNGVIGHDQIILRIKIESAISCAMRFEPIIKRLIKERKFLR